MSDQYIALLDTADSIIKVDLYPARLRTAISDLSKALRETSVLLTESRTYALALEAELQHRAEKTDKLLSLANSMDADFQRYAEAHPTSLRITGPNSDGEYWLHIKSNGRSGGVNLGTEHGPICKRLLDVASETGAALKGETP